MRRRGALGSGLLALTLAGSLSPHPNVSIQAAAPPPLGPPPHNCGGSASTLLTGVFGKDTSMTGVGAFPTWAAGFTGSHATLRFGAMADAPGAYEAPYGWGHKVLWMLAPQFKGRVTLRGGSVHGSAPLWFDVVEEGAPNAPARVMTLDARRQKAFSGGPGAWPAFPSGLYIPQAGCYYLQARWPGGSWRITFAAGR